MLNSINIIGRIITDLELKKTTNGSNTLSFRIACQRDHAKEGEERVSDYFSVIAFGSNATFIMNNFENGAMIGITGRLESFSHPAEKGKKFASVQIRVLSASFTGEHRDKDPSLFDNNQ